MTNAEFLRPFLSRKGYVPEIAGLYSLTGNICGHAEGLREGVKAAGIACVASAIPTLIGVRVIPWAKANLNYTAQALIISAASIASYFIVSEKTILECSRRNAIEQYKNAESLEK